MSRRGKLQSACHRDSAAVAWHPTSCPAQRRLESAANRFLGLARDRMPGASWRTKTFRQAQSGQLGTRAKSVVANHLAPSHTSTLSNTRENAKKFSTTGHQCGKAYCRDAALATEQARPGMLEFRWHDLGFWPWPFLSESFGWCSTASESASCPTRRITAMSD